MTTLRTLALLALAAALAAAAAPATTHEYYVNRNAQDDGDHEVHREGCSHPPQPQNRVPLGSFADCHAAVRAAKKRFATADGCYHCSRPCDTG
jgi:hypothetical protein